MEVKWVTKRVVLRARSDEALERRIDALANALRVHAGSILALKRPLGRRNAKRRALILYEFPIRSSY